MGDSILASHGYFKEPHTSCQFCRLFYRTLDNPIDTTSLCFIFGDVGIRVGAVEGLEKVLPWDFVSEMNREEWQCTPDEAK